VPTPQPPSAVGQKTHGDQLCPQPLGTALPFAREKRNQEAKTQPLFEGSSDLLAAPASAHQQQRDTALVSMCLFLKASFQASGVLATAAGWGELAQRAPNAAIGSDRAQPTPIPKKSPSAAPCDPPRPRKLSGKWISASTCTKRSFGGGWQNPGPGTAAGPVGLPRWHTASPTAPERFVMGNQCSVIGTPRFLVPHVVKRQGYG